MNLDYSVVLTKIPILLEGCWVTLQISFFALLLGMVFGIAGALCRISSSRILGSIAFFYVWVIRGTPVMVQLFILYFGLPQLGTNGAWVYQGAAASPKSEIVKTERLRVVKQWADEGNEAKRPTSVKVQILHEGTVVDTRTLDASNDWSYAWDALADGSSWTVQEVDVPDGYSASVTHDGAVFTLVNTYTNPGVGTSVKPGVPWTGDPTSWIVIVAVALVGLALVLVGRAFSHRDDGE